MIENTSRRGPWFYQTHHSGEYYTIHSRPMFELADFLSCVCLVDIEHKEEADMIVAAPDMYAAGKMLLERLAAHRSEDEWPQAMREAIAAMREAVARADGTNAQTEDA